MACLSWELGVRDQWEPNFRTASIRATDTHPQPLLNTERRRCHRPSEEGGTGEERTVATLALEEISFVAQQQ